MLSKKTSRIKLNTKTIGDFLDVGLISTNSEGKITGSNSKVMDLLDLSPRDFLDIGSYRDLLTALVSRGDYGAKDVKSSVQKKLDRVNSHAKAATPQNPAKLDCHYTLPNGNVLLVKKIIAQDTSLLIAITDVTKETIREQTLLAALEMGSSGYVYHCFAQNRSRYHSDYFTNILNSEEKKRLKHDGFWTLIHPDDVDRVKGIWQQVSSDGTTQKLYIRCITEKNGQVWFKAFFCPQVSSSGTVTGITSYFTDVTETLSIEGALRMSKKNLEKALQLKTDFISRVSHEVRTPMNAMVGIADALINHHNDPAITPKLQLIQDSSVNILRILDETLDYAKLEADEIKIDPHLADPASVVTRVCKLWQEIANRKSVTLKYKIDPSVPKNIVFDAHRYEQCLNNLVSNAIKFAEGGKVDVLLTRLKKGNNPPQLVLAVKDTGIGMTPDQERNLFEPFKQADHTIAKRYGGTGLGMKITRDIIGLMGGKISVKTAPNKGTIFMIALPLEQNTQQSALTAQLGTLPPVKSPKRAPAPAQTIKTKPAPRLALAPKVTAIKPPIKTDNMEDLQALSSRSLQSRKKMTPLATGSDLTGRIMGLGKSEPQIRAPKEDTKPSSPYENLRVLVVDDNATNHLVVQSLLEGLVGTIYVANNGQEALDVLEVKDVDVVFMDIHMPVMDGIEATLAIRNSSAPWSGVRIVALTADPLYQQKRLCMNIGMDYALAKPVKLADLREALDATGEIEPLEMREKRMASA